MNVLQPYFTEEQIENILAEQRKCFESGWIGMGPKVLEFEKKWAEFVGAKYAVATNSCTSALDIAVRLIPLPNPVKVSAFTFISSALSPLNAGYDVEFVDIDPETLCTPRADIQVMYAGNQAGTGLIYDMAHSGGAKHKGKISCWSFHAVKNLPTGDGGMITMNSKKLYEQAKALSWCGINKSTFERSKKKYNWDYQVTCQGLKAHMNDLTAIIGLEKLKSLKKDNEYRKKLAETYNRYLPDWIIRPYESETWHLYTIQVPRRNNLLDYLASKGVNCGLHYKPLTHYKIFGKQKKLKVTEDVFKHIISLPIHLNMGLEDAREVCRLINGYFSNKSN